MQGYFQRVYKYEKLDICKLILSNRTLRFTKPTKFKDLLDCSEEIVEATEDFVYEAVNRRYKNVPTTLKIKILSQALERYRNGEEIMKSFYFQEREKMIVTCFSKRSNNEYMWENYAQNHTGLCLEFFLENQVKLDGLGEIYPLEVNYYPPNKKVIYKHGDAEWIGDWVTSKSLDYSEEEEVRWLFIGVNLNGDSLDIVYPHKLLSKVIFGKQTSSSDRKEIVKLVQREFKGFNIAFAEMVHDKNSGTFKEIPFHP